MKWFRWYRGACQNPVFAMVAEEADQEGGGGEGNRCYGAVTVTDVIAVWAVILEDASNSDHWGTCKKDAKFISIVLRWWEDEVQCVLDAMQKHEMISVHSGGIDVENWDKYQKFSDKDPTNADRQKRYRNRKKRHSNALRMRPDTDTDTEPDKKPPLPPKGNDASDLIFDEFWKMYPRQRRGNRTKALTAWKRALERSSSGDILVGLRAYCESDEVRRGFAKGAAAWLNDDRWKSDYRTFRTKTNEEQLQDWINGDERGDQRGDTIDGECVEVPRRDQGNGESVLPCVEGSERRSDDRGGNGSAIQLGEDEPAETERHQEVRHRIEAVTEFAATAIKAPTKP